MNLAKSRGRASTNQTFFAGEAFTLGKRAHLAAAAAIFVNNPYQSPPVNSSGILIEIVTHMNILRVRVHYPYPYTRYRGILRSLALYSIYIRVYSNSIEDSSPAYADRFYPPYLYFNILRLFFVYKYPTLYVCKWQI